MAPHPHRSLLLLPVFLILICDFVPAAASPTSLPSDLFPRNATSSTSEHAHVDCTTDFSADYYGFGVRLGVYFAWLSSYFANTLLPSEISGSLDTNSIFLLALIASLFKGSLNGEIFQIDALIIMQLSSGFLFSSFSIWGYRTSHYQNEGPDGIQHFGKFGTHCRLALAVSISMYGTWFWWEGLEDGLLVAEDPQCQQLYTWLFTEWPTSGGVSKFYIVVSMMCSIYFGIMVFTAVLAGIFKLLRIGWKGEMKYRTGFSVWELKFLFNIFRIFNLFWIIFCASMIEMTLTKNNMLSTLAQNGNIAYPAQLLPLIVGALSFLRVLWLIHAEWRERAVKQYCSVHTPNGSFESDATGEPKTAGTATATTKKLFFRNLFSLNTLKKIVWPSPRPSETVEPVFEIQHPYLPYALRPWHHRYSVSVLPWLSIFDSWRMADGYSPTPDMERPTAPSTSEEVKEGFEEQSKEVPS